MCVFLCDSLSLVCYVCRGAMSQRWPSHGAAGGRSSPSAVFPACGQRVCGWMLPSSWGCQGTCCSNCGPLRASSYCGGHARLMCMHSALTAPCAYQATWLQLRHTVPCACPIDSDEGADHARGHLPNTQPNLSVHGGRLQHLGAYSTGPGMGTYCATQLGSCGLYRTQRSRNRKLPILHALC